MLRPPPIRFRYLLARFCSLKYTVTGLSALGDLKLRPFALRICPICLKETLIANALDVRFSESDTQAPQIRVMGPREPRAPLAIKPEADEDVEMKLVTVHVEPSNPELSQRDFKQTIGQSASSVPATPVDTSALVPAVTAPITSPPGSSVNHPTRLTAEKTSSHLFSSAPVSSPSSLTPSWPPDPSSPSAHPRQLLTHSLQATPGMAKHTTLCEWMHPPLGSTGSRGRAPLTGLTTPKLSPTPWLGPISRRPFRLSHLLIYRMIQATATFLLQLIPSPTPIGASTHSAEMPGPHLRDPQRCFAH